MRKISLLLLCLMSGLLVFAQADQPNQKPAPSFFKLNQEKSLNEATQLLADFAKAGPETSFSESKTNVDDLGMTHVTYQQFVNGVPVDGYTYTVHANGGVIQTVSGAFAKTGDIQPTPAISEDRGLSAALTELDLHQPMWESADAPADYNKPEGELVVFFNPDSKTANLAFKYDVYTAEPLYRAWVYVDAVDGKVLFENLRIHHANDPIQAVSDYNGTVGITGNLSNGVYSLNQTVSGGGVETFSLNNGTSYGGASSVTDNGSPFNSDGTAVQAHYGAEQTWEYFNSAHGRNSYNGTGGRLLSYVHYSTNYVNAFWDGSRMTYGDGDGTNYGPLTSLDIAGHEMAHGVTEFSANLAYRRESGALNESFSDIFGEMVEFAATGSNNWQMGTDIGIGGSGAIRSMNNPSSFGDPDTYGGQNWTNPNCGTPTQSNDYCGVHSNSGVQNKWFYILAVGESGTNDIGSAYSVTGIGRTAAGAIAYRNLTQYLSANSTFADARSGAIQSAVDLYGAGSAEEIATTDAWYAVGVGNAFGGGGGPAACVGTDVTLTLVTDGYASESSWTLKNSAGVTVHSNGSLANNQTYTLNWTLANDDYTFTINDSYGDGICCQYGNGSYSLESGGVVMGSGASFGSFATVPFCVDNAAPDTEAPSVPAAVTASNIDITTLDLSWVASTDNVGVAGYEVFVDGTSVGTTTSTSYNITGLTSATTYTFDVQAFDAAGNTSASGSTTATTAAVAGNCAAAAVTLTLITDGYASETSWTLKNSAGAIVESNGSLVNNQSYTLNWALATDDYTFTINDSYGDGICCQYGNGSYSIESGGVVIGSGASFGSSEDVVFCVDASGTGADTQAPTTPTGVTASNISDNDLDLTWAASTDNVGVTGYEVFVDGMSVGTVTSTSTTVFNLTAGTTYNFDVVASDAAGNSSSPGSTTATTTGGGNGGPQVILGSYFETGWDGWIDGGSDCIRYSGSRSYEGNFSIYLRDNTNSSTMTTSASFDISGASTVDVDFYFLARSMEAGEDFWVQYQDNGGAWQTVGVYASGTHFNNNSFYSANVVMSAADYNFSTNARFRLRCDASANNDGVHLDQVVITTDAGSAPLLGGPMVSSQSCKKISTPQFFSSNMEEQEVADFHVAVSPNPASDRLRVNVSNGDLVSAAFIYSSTGQQLQVLENDGLNGDVDVSTFSAGLYFLVVQTSDGETETVRFVVK